MNCLIFLHVETNHIHSSPTPNVTVTHWCLGVVMSLVVACCRVDDEVEEGTVSLGCCKEGKVAAEMWVVDVLATRHCEVATEILDMLGTYVIEVLQVMV